MAERVRARWRGGALLGLAVVLGCTGALLPAQAVTASAAPRSTGPTLSFLTFNVCKSDCAPPAPSWDVRRDRVARVINESGASVVGVQEATNWGVTHAKTQWQDIQDLTAPAGYVAPAITYDSDECAYRKHVACTHTARLLFRSSEVRQVVTPNATASAGFARLQSIVSGLDGISAIREVGWAYLEGLNGTGPFLAVSIHLPNEKDATREAARVAVAAGMLGWVDAMNAAHGLPGTPVVLLADLNSYVARQPNGAQKVLTNGGWLDAWSAPSTRNRQYSSINLTPQTRQWGGYPPRPYVFRNRPATRIDYILARGGVSVLDYEVVVHLLADGSFDPEYQASDHQAVRAVLGFPAR
jgi:endonuclease/exonuclease/phosphatase family metal-dependent hydrolase